MYIHIYTYTHTYTSYTGRVHAKHAEKNGREHEFQGKVIIE